MIVPFHVHVFDVDFDSDFLITVCRYASCICNAEFLEEIIATYSV